MAKKILKYFGVFFSLVILAVCGYLYLYNPQNTIYLEAEYMFDISDKRLLVNWADNVYVGTVIKKVKEYKDDVSPVTVYDVMVQENLMGTLSGNIQVSQRIGYDRLTKALIMFEGDNYLEEQTKYLFVSKYDPETNTHWVVPVEGKIALKAQSDEIKVKEEFKQAILSRKNN